jgi:transcription elongation factor GreA
MRSLGLDVDGPIRWGDLPTGRSAGVIVVETVSPMTGAPIDHGALRRWLERVPSLLVDDTRPSPSVLAQRLSSFWVPGQTLLYVTRAEKGAASRVAAMYATELGHRRPHPGGHWLKTLRDPVALLRLWWAETDAGEEYEDALIEAFAGAVPEVVRSTVRGEALLPWANLASPGGIVRATGLTGSLLSAEATPSPSPSARRSDGSASVRHTNVRAATPRSPRRTTTRPGPGEARASPARPEPTHLTIEGLAALEAELERLRVNERPQVVARIRQARELGDLRENADYEAARHEQSFLEGRIRELEGRLRGAVLISATAHGAIALGSTVRYDIDGRLDELTIVGSTESDPAAGRISAVSPVGRALLGRRAGDEVDVVTPAARVRYRIHEVR